ncbi:MAG TPA: amidase [Burkholderiales bacterium]|nr:amidase [Burkholderiales bacterium]
MNTPTDPCSLTAAELLALYRAKRLSPVEATRAVLERIERLNPVLNAFCLVDTEAAIASAMESEARWMKDAPMGALDGVPVSIKDVILARGWPTLRGSKTIDPKGPWDDDAPAVARLREAGAVLHGKTTTPEFGWKGVTDSPLTGITRNPRDPRKTPGGSSGGAAAAVASGMGPLAVGTDGGGSIRIPCAFTGLFGIKPTFGRVPAWPPSPMGTVAHVGPIARSVADAALMLMVMSRPDARDWTALPYDGRDYREGLEDGVRGLRIAYSANLGYARVDREVAEIVKKAVRTFDDLGARVEERDPGFEDPQETFSRHWFPGAALVVSSVPAKKRSLIDKGLREIARRGERITALEHFEAAQKRNELGLAMSRFHVHYDLLVTPTLSVAAFDVGREAPKNAKSWVSWTPFTFPFNLTQQPAASIPCGLTKAGLPVGLHIIGPRYAEAQVLRAARAFEVAHPFAMPDLSKLAK